MDEEEEEELLWSSTLSGKASLVGVEKGGSKAANLLNS